jgi:hypothetical protein
MPLEGILTFARNAPGAVVANHLEALNHCPTRRVQLKQILADQGLGAKLYVPEDGETLKIATGEPPIGRPPYE